MKLDRFRKNRQELAKHFGLDIIQIKNRSGAAYAAPLRIKCNISLHKGFFVLSFLLWGSL